MKKNRKRKGFTLIELIVVIAIIGILAAITVPRLSGFQTSAKKKADIATGKTIATAVSTLIADEKIAIGTAKIISLDSTTVAGTGSDAAYLRGYLQNVPKNMAGNYAYTISVSATGDVEVHVGVFADYAATIADAAKEVFPSQGTDY